MMHKKCGPKLAIWILVTIGALNWGLAAIGYFAEMNLNIVNLALGSWPTVENIVYLLVGLAGIASFFHCKCKKCMGCKCTDGNCTHCNVDASKTM